MSSTVYDAAVAWKMRSTDTAYCVASVILLGTGPALIYFAVTASESIAVPILTIFVSMSTGAVMGIGSVLSNYRKLHENLKAVLKPALETAAVIDAAVALGEVSGVTPAQIIVDIEESGYQHLSNFKIAVGMATASNVTLEVVTTDPVSLSWMRAGHGRYPDKSIDKIYSDLNMTK
jgi:hypothetical protein